MKHLYPTPPGAIPNIKKALNLKTDEEAYELSNIRKYYDLSILNLPAPEVSKQDKEITCNGYTVKISILRPIGSEDTILPVVLYFHGGGFTFGNYLTSRMLTNNLVNMMPACVVFVDYSLSPETKYPVALEECYSALCWTQQNAESIRVDVNQLAVVGDSAGGCLSTALTMLAKQRGNNGITYQVLYYPMVDTDITRDSYIEFKDDPVLGGSFATYFWKQYLTDIDQVNENTAKPLRSTAEDLKGLPPAFILTCEKDVLRSEGELYATRLREANVKVIAIRYLGVSHGFLTGVSAPAESNAAIMQTIDVLKRHWQSSQSKI